MSTHFIQGNSTLNNAPFALVDVRLDGYNTPGASLMLGGVHGGIKTFCGMLWSYRDLPNFQTILGTILPDSRWILSLEIEEGLAGNRATGGKLGWSRGRTDKRAH